MERKTFSSGDKFPSIKDTLEFLPKVAIKPKDPSYTYPKTQNKNPQTNSKENESLSSCPKAEISQTSIPKPSENKKGIHLPILSKREKVHIISSNNNNRSPCISPEPSHKIHQNSNQEDLTNSNKEEFKSPLRGSSASRGFRSRRSKMRQNKKTEKNREENLDLLLMHRKNSDFEFLMSEYVRRQGLDEKVKVFILTGQHEFMRRALKKRGWVENKNVGSLAYNLKWCYNDCDDDYKTLKQGQLYNHFLNNREITTKSGLSKNLRNIVDYRVNIDMFFPRCYDLGDGVQVKELVKDYNRTAILNVLKKYLEGCAVDQDLFNFCKSFSEHLLNIFQSKCEKAEKNFEIRQDDLKKCINFSPKIKSESQDLSSILSVQKTLEGLNKFLPQLRIEGSENVWIIKPGQNSRGSGVRCVKDLEEIIDSGYKMQSRIVQKYTECPLLLPLSSGMCKFDLRIWVLVTSFDPLLIYMYNTCYCRLCQEPYNLSSLDPYRHLANYSIQKSVAKSQASTIWTSSQLSEYLKTLGKSWEEILPKIHYIIIQSLLSVVDLIESKSGCFELYGFDILIDSNFNPWLLEVNLSPACAERTEWVTETLDHMGEGILKIILDESSQNPLYSAKLSLHQAIKGNTQEWVMLFKGENTEEGVNLKNNVEIIGEKFNLKREKKIERKYLINKAAFVIQYQMKQYMKKVKIEKQKINHCVLSIQKTIRTKIARSIVVMKKKTAACIKIQSFFRMVSAQKLKANLKGIRLIEFLQSVMKSFVERKRFKKSIKEQSCLNIQKLIRRKIALNKAKKEKFYLESIIKIQKEWRMFYQKKLSNCSNLQRVLRGFLARRDCKKRVLFKSSVITIQKIYRKKLAVKEVLNRKKAKAESIIRKYENFRIFIKALSLFRFGQAAVIIQKYWRRHNSKKILALKRLQKQIMIDNINLVQKTIKGFIERKKFKYKVQKKNAVIIQAFFRGYRTRKYFKILQKVHKSALVIQKNFRKYLARKRYLIVKRIYHEEKTRRHNFLVKKKEMEKKAIQVTERLFKGRGFPEVPIKMQSKFETFLNDREEKLDKIRNIYNQFDDIILMNEKYERSSLIKSIIEDMRPQKKEKKPKKSRKKNSISISGHLKK